MLKFRKQNNFALVMEPFDQSLMNISMSLIHVSRSYRAAADTLVANFSLSQASAWPLIIISRAGGDVRPGVIAERLNIEPPSLVRIINQLIDAKLVERREDPHDRRAKLLHLTADGEMRAQQLEEVLIRFRSDLFQKIDKDDIAAFKRVLDQLGAAIDGLKS